MPQYISHWHGSGRDRSSLEHLWGSLRLALIISGAARRANTRARHCIVYVPCTMHVHAWTRW